MRSTRPDRGIQSVVIPLPAAESAVGRLRTGGDPWALRGMAAHITIAGHWPLATVLPLDQLRSISDAAVGTPLILDRVAALGDAICLFPADDAPLLAVRHDILAAVGVADAKDAEWRPHLTVCRATSPVALRNVREELAGFLPIACAVRSLAVVRAPDGGKVTIVDL